MKRPLYNYVRQIKPHKIKNKIAINTFAETRENRIDDSKFYLKVYEYDNIEFCFNKVVEYSNGIYGGTYKTEKEYYTIKLDELEINVSSEEYNRVSKIILNKYKGEQNE